MLEKIGHTLRLLASFIFGSFRFLFSRTRITQLTKLKASNNVPKAGAGGGLGWVKPRKKKRKNGKSCEYLM